MGGGGFDAQEITDLDQEKLPAILCEELRPAGLDPRAARGSEPGEAGMDAPWRPALRAGVVAALLAAAAPASSQSLPLTQLLPLAVCDSRCE